MLRLALIVYIFLGPTLAGTALVAALTMGRIDSTSVIATAVVGFLLAVPLAWVVARQIKEQG